MRSADIDEIFDAFRDAITESRDNGMPVNDAAITRAEEYLEDVENGDDDIDIDYLDKLTKEVLGTE